MESVSLKQIAPLRQKLALASPAIVLGILISKENLMLSVLLILISLIVFSASYSLVITKEFKNYFKIYTLGLPLFRISKRLRFPDYISLFNQSFIQTNHEGFSPNTLGDTRYKMYTIKFFNDNGNDIVFQSKNKELIIGLGQDLCSMLDVELYNTLE